MINVKERFGYTKVITCDDNEKKVLFAYCEGKSCLWQMFLGWRLSKADGTTIFWIPSNKIKELIKIAKDFQKAY